MPILPAEPDIFPDDLLDAEPPSIEPGASESIQGHAHWWALYTLPRREKELVRRLRALGIAHYGPLVARRSRSPKGRTITSHVPLFPSYVFLFGDETARYSSMTTNCVSRYITVDNPEQLVRDLQQIRRLIQSGTPLTPEARLQPGMRVRIRSGSLAGTEGVVLKRHGVERLLVAVRFLQQGVSMQIEDFQLERIDG